MPLEAARMPAALLPVVSTICRSATVTVPGAHASNACADDPIVLTVPVLVTETLPPVP